MAANDGDAVPESLIDALTEAEPNPEGAGTEDDLRAYRIALGVLRRPKATFGRLAEHTGRRWLLPTLAFVLLSTALALAMALSPAAAARAQAEMTRQMGQSGVQMSDEEMAQLNEFTSSGLMRTFAVVSALIGGLLGSVAGLLLVSALFHFLAAMFGGQQSFTQMFTVIAWAGLPLILGLCVKLAATLSGVLPTSAGLAGLAADPLTGSSSPLAAFLAQIELWHLWTLALYVLALRAVARISRGKAIGAVLILVGLQVLLGLGLFFAGQMARGITGA